LIGVLSSDNSIGWNRNPIQLKLLNGKKRKRKRKQKSTFWNKITYTNEVHTMVMASRRGGVGRLRSDPS